MLYRVLVLICRKEPSNVVLYARVPCAGQKTDPENQLDYLKDFAAVRCARGEKKAGGYSLVELLVLVGISFFVLAMAFPASKSGLLHQMLFMTARQLAQDIRTCQQENMSTYGQVFEIIFDVTKDRYYLVSGLNTHKKVVLPASVDLVWAVFPGGEKALRFTSSGSPLPGGGTITLMSRTSNSFCYVIVAPVTGRVRISTTPPASWYDG